MWHVQVELQAPIQRPLNAYGWRKYSGFARHQAKLLHGRANCCGFARFALAEAVFTHGFSFQQFQNLLFSSLSKTEAVLYDCTV